jgi:hypothetical protein
MKTSENNTNRTNGTNNTAAAVRTAYTLNGTAVHARGAYTLHATAARAVARNAHGKRLPRPERQTATAAALLVALVAARAAYSRTSENTAAYNAVNAALANGDAAAYRAAAAVFERTSANAENGTRGILNALRGACGAFYRLRRADAATRTACVYDALNGDTSGAALEMFGGAYAVIYASRQHEHAVFMPRVLFKRAAHACNAVLYAARTRTAKTAVAVEQIARDGDGDGIAYGVPKFWDVQTFDELDYLQHEIAALRAACGGAAKYERFVTLRLRGCTYTEIAAALRVTPRTVANIADAVRAAYNRTHGTAYAANAYGGTASAR